ncbi:DUF2785 domain-containing protein [Planococcus ruber]|uniref:DUF2785 domain-containing protein n=1 Tax=Planococcus ruber TaxID=2027871 RepID=UPI001FEE1A68|nr:DUF2785 domain-containing protein [Planococcus ruber]MCJ1909795.1 DUF2785 domain-containing protein [Planococcus ruber]
MTEEELKQELQGEHAIEDALIQSMADHIGSVDSELRDGLIYGTFSTWIMEDRLKGDQLAELLDISLELLFKGIGENETDTVFTRSFASLLIALILYSDNKNDFLPEAAIHQVKHGLVTYLATERDIRGYVPVKGWAHSVAHAADAFDELVQNPKLDSAAYPELAETLWNKIFVSDSVYVHGEDERLLVPLMELLNRGMSDGVIVELLKEMPTQLELHKQQVAEENYWFLAANCKGFLKSFYMKLAPYPSYHRLQETIGKSLSQVY